MLRDARLIVIASEDTYAVADYFKRFRTRRLQFIIIPTEGGQSRPKTLPAWTNSSESSKQNPTTSSGSASTRTIGQIPDTSTRLVQVLQHCRQAGFRTAISNPCFELWLLLHFEDPKLPPDCKCSEIGRRLSTIAGGYNKTACDRLPINAAMVRDALSRAKAIENGSVIPDTPLTRVYLIIEVLQEREAIDLD